MTENNINPQEVHKTQFNYLKSIETGIFMALQWNAGIYFCNLLQRVRNLEI